MLCSNCGKEITTDSLFCPNCGANVAIKKESKKTFDFTKNQKIIILALLSIIVALLCLIVFLPGKNTRTIMIYLDGSNLESDHGIVTTELKNIDPKMIDLNKTNVLLYTGGTTKWQNYISNKENGIYILKGQGFEKILSEKQLNLGAPDTLANFLKYGYENYKADKYNLILYNHGGAIDGAIYDDFSNDNLSLMDMAEAMKKSPFNENNKLDAVLFRTCLNGTIEVANIFAPYAKYFIGSEEVSYGRTDASVLNFINEVNENDNGDEYGKKFVDAYNKQMEIIDPLNLNTTTYSVIDLSKIEKVNQELDTYIASIDLNKYYNSISKLRATIFQYGTDATDYDMIDLYDFVVRTKSYASIDNKKILDAIKDAVVYNKSNNEDSHGLSIYFPYKGRDAARKKFLSVYNNLNYSNSYKTFINAFYNGQTTSKSYSFAFNKSDISTDNKNNKISIKLTDEQLENYAASACTILIRNKKHPDYYMVIYDTDDTIIDNNILTVDYTNKLIQSKNDKTGEYEYTRTYYRKINGFNTAGAILTHKDKDWQERDAEVIATLMITKNSNGNAVISGAKLISDNERVDGILLDINEYKKYQIVVGESKILAADGKVLPSEKWEMAPDYYIWYGEMDDEFKYASLDFTLDNDYYALFKIKDINGNISYSELIKVGE